MALVRRSYRVRQFVKRDTLDMFVHAVLSADLDKLNNPTFISGTRKISPLEIPDNVNVRRPWFVRVLIRSPVDDGDTTAYAVSLGDLIALGAKR